jgi:O-acetylhomoserine/O-acetylserine sulfhydrylase-like pyridoxal-dependent enzyme
MEEILIGAVEVPEFTEPSAGYHGYISWSAGNAAFTKVRIEGLRDYGAAFKSI